MERIFHAQSLSLSDNTKTRSAVSPVEYLYEKIPPTEIFSSLKVAKKHAHVYCFQGKHLTCWDLCSMLETGNFVQKDSKQTLPVINIANRWPHQIVGNHL